MRKEKETIVVDTGADKIELRSEEFRDILGTVPPWILRWGITALGIVVIILLVGSALFKYPDIISSTMTLTGMVPPADIVAKSSGKLSELYVSDNATVKEGTYLAIIENPANTADVLLLKEYLEKMDPDSESFILLSKNLEVGTFQSNYSAFYLTLFKYREYKRMNYYETKSEIIRKRIEQYQTQLQNQLRQQAIVKEQLSLAKGKFQRDSLLHTKGIVTDDEFETAKSQYLQGLLSYENISASVDNSRIQIGQMEESLFETGYQHVEEENNLHSTLMTLLTQLKTEIKAWELSYVLASPIDGKITFTNYWVENQNVTAGENIFHIIPADSVKLIGKAFLPVTGSGKVEVGQKVNIRFENFPDNEYGLVKGIVKNISLVPAKGGEIPGYTVEIELPEGLHTTYHKELPYLPEINAQADIITKEVSVLERFIMPIRKAIREGFE